MADHANDAKNTSLWRFQFTWAGASEKATSTIKVAPFGLQNATNHLKGLKRGDVLDGDLGWVGVISMPALHAEGDDRIDTFRRPDPFEEPAVQLQAGSLASNGCGPAAEVGVEVVTACEGGPAAGVLPGAGCVLVGALATGT